MNQFTKYLDIWLFIADSIKTYRFTYRFFSKYESINCLFRALYLDFDEPLIRDYPELSTLKFLHYFTVTVLIFLF